MDKKVLDLLEKMKLKDFPSFCKENRDIVYDKYGNVEQEIREIMYLKRHLLEKQKDKLQCEEIENMKTFIEDNKSKIDKLMSKDHMDEYFKKVGEKVTILDFELEDIKKEFENNGMNFDLDTDPAFIEGANLYFDSRRENYVNWDRRLQTPSSNGSKFVGFQIELGSNRLSEFIHKNNLNEDLTIEEIVRQRYSHLITKDTIKEVIMNSYTFNSKYVADFLIESYGTNLIDDEMIAIFTSRFGVDNFKEVVPVLDKVIEDNGILCESIENEVNKIVEGYYNRYMSDKDKMNDVITQI